MSEYIHKSHNVSVLLYHLVCPTKWRNGGAISAYRRAVVPVPVEETLKKVCGYMETSYEITFLEIGSDLDHVHFAKWLCHLRDLIHSVPSLSPSRLAQIIKNITSRELRSRLPILWESLWGAAFWSTGYFINTVGRAGSESTIRRYVEQQSNYQLVYAPQAESSQL